MSIVARVVAESARVCTVRCGELRSVIHCGRVNRRADEGIETTPLDPALGLQAKRSFPRAGKIRQSLITCEILGRLIVCNSINYNLVH